MHSQQGTEKCSSVVSISEGQACRIALKHCLGQIDLFWHLTVVKMSYMSFFSPDDLCKKIAGIIQQWYILKLYTVVRLLQMYRYWGSSGSYLLRQVLDPPVGVRSKKVFFRKPWNRTYHISVYMSDGSGDRLREGPWHWHENDLLYNHIRPDSHRDKHFLD